MFWTKENKSTVLLVITAIIWGVGFVAQREAMHHMEPFIFNAIRFGLGGLSLIPVAMLLERGGINRATIIAGLAGGSVLFVAAAFQQWGIALTASASKAGFITGLYIIIVPILGIIAGRKSGRLVWVGALLAVAGLYLISAPEGLLVIDMGTILLLLCAVGWAVHILVVDRVVTGIKPLSFASVQFLVCAILSLSVAVIFEDIRMSGMVAAYVPIIFSAFFSVFIAFTLQVLGQQHVPPGRSAIIFSMESVVAAIAEVILLGVFLTGFGYAGGGLIFAGIIVSQLRRESKA